MIKIVYLSHGRLASSSLEELKIDSKELWIDCLSPTKKEIKILSEKINIPVNDFTRALDEDERPHVLEFDDYSLITFRAPFQNKAGNHTTVSLSIFIKNQTVIILRSKHIESIEKLFQMEDKKKVEILQKDVTYTIFMILDNIITHFARISDDLEDRIDKIEQNVIKSQTARTVKQIFNLKKTLIYFHHSLTGNREVITGIQKRFVKEIKGPNIKMFSFLYMDVVQLIDMIVTYRDILTSSLDIYLTTVSNNTNEVMKRLTLITSFILVPSLIAGIYGMNFRYIPEVHDLQKYGYPFALGLMVVSVILVYVYFKRKNWI